MKEKGGVTVVGGGMQITACQLIIARMRVADWRKSQANLGPNGQVMPYGDHALYHGISATEWQGKLATAIANAGTVGPLAVGISLEPKYPWENETESVAARFAAIRQSGVEHVALFVWAHLPDFGLPEDVAAAWGAALRAWAAGGGV